MNLDTLTHTSGEWLRGTGPEQRQRLLQEAEGRPQIDSQALVESAQRKFSVPPFLRLNPFPPSPPSPP